MDAFSGVPFAGNPAAVCLLPAAMGRPSTALLQQIAQGWAQSILKVVRFLSELEPLESGDSGALALAFESPPAQVLTCQFKLAWHQEASPDTR